MGAILLLALIGAIIGIILRGWVLTILWDWFIVSSFGLPPIGIATALGISIIIATFTNNNKHFKDEENKKTHLEAVAEFLGAVIGAQILVLLLGWIVHLFI